MGCFCGTFGPLASPDPLDPLVVDEPASLLQQPGDLAIAVAALLPGKLNDAGSELLFVFTAPRYLALRRAVLPERRTDATLRSFHDCSDLLDTARRRAGLRSFPGGLLQNELVQRQVRIALRRRLFSCSSSFGRPLLDGLEPPPYSCRHR